MSALTPIVQSSLSAVAYLLIGMAMVAVIESIIPLHRRTRAHTAHLVPNLTLTFITFATNIVFNVALVLLLLWLEAIGFGLLHQLEIDPLLAVAIAILVLDFSTYAAHVAMHESPSLWRFHRIHHSDPAVDVTTTVRQHPVEGMIRYAVLAVFAAAIGASALAFAVYRIWSALQGLLEHANIRLPLTLDKALALVIVSPNMHKVHHSRDAALTDTNYGNLTSLWDRLFLTFTPADRGADIDYGLDGLDDDAGLTTRGLLTMPWREPGIAERAA